MEAIQDLFRRFLDKIDEPWTLNNLSLQNVDMKYNEIISRMTKSARDRKQPGVGIVDYRPYKPIK